MSKVLCQLNDEGFQTKPSDLKFYGKLREKMIQKPWSYVDEKDFVHKVSNEGYAFYGCLFDGHDLMETGRQRECWKAQTIIGVDIDKSATDPLAMAAVYAEAGLTPWLVYSTFSDGDNGKRSYRLLWKVEVDLRVTYEQWAYVIKALSTMTPEGDPRACDCSRLWQGSRKGRVFYLPQKPVTYKKFMKAIEAAS